MCDEVETDPEKQKRSTLVFLRWLATVYLLHNGVRPPPLGSWAVVGGVVFPASKIARLPFSTPILPSWFSAGHPLTPMVKSHGPYLPFSLLFDLWSDRWSEIYDQRSDSPHPPGRSLFVRVTKKGRELPTNSNRGVQEWNAKERPLSSKIRHKRWPQTAEVKMRPNF